MGRGGGGGDCDCDPSCAPAEALEEEEKEEELPKSRRENILPNAEVTLVLVAVGGAAGSVSGWAANGGDVDEASSPQAFQRPEAVLPSAVLPSAGVLANAGGVAVAVLETAEIGGNGNEALRC